MKGVHYRDLGQGNSTYSLIAIAPIKNLAKGKHTYFTKQKVFETFSLILILIFT
jgi:hypothetical protein